MGAAAQSDEADPEMFKREILMFDVWREQFERDGELPAVPAATVVVLRDSPAGIESLMLRKNSRDPAFGGMWVFPGGRIEDADHDCDSDIVAAARNAAVREAHEEAAIELDPDALTYFSYWIPPPIAPKRYATWFFVTEAPGGEVTIDDGEIVNHEWMTPAEAMGRHEAGEMEIIIPTWVTLRTISGFGTVAEAIDALRQRKPRHYVTRIGRGPEGPVSMWSGDAGYETVDPSVPGSRHRVEVTPDGYRLDESGYRDPL